MKQLWEKIKRMARPRILRTKDGGELTLKNVSPEVVAAVEAALGGGGNTVGVDSEEIAPPAVAPAPRSSSEHPMLSPAVGVYQDPLTLDWHVVTLKFSHISKQAEVATDLNSGKDREMLRERFKIQVIKEGLI